MLPGGTTKRKVTLVKTARQVQDAFWESIIGGNFEGIRKLADPSFQLFLPGLPPLPVEDTISAAQAWKAAFSDFGETRRVVEIIESPDGLACALAVSETLIHNGPFRTPDGRILEPTGRAITLDSNHLFAVASDGRMLHWRIQFDATAMVAQLS